jgi:uncharacterized protein (TIGR02145 family)
MENRSIAITIRVVLVALFAGCLFDMSYGYYQLVRFLGMAGFAVLAAMEYRKSKTWAIVWAFSALLVNPFFKIALGRELWNVVDIAWVIMLPLSMLKRFSLRYTSIIFLACTMVACSRTAQNEALVKDVPDTTMVEDIDGNTYRTVLIDSRVWMAENLRTTRFANGDTIAYVVDDGQWKVLKSPALSTYDNDSSLAHRFGHLYNWWAASDIRNICPRGWHIPTESEWQQLFDHLGGIDEAGAKMKATGTSLWCKPNEGATNSSGFAALPGGLKSSAGNYSSIGTYGCWWSSTENGLYNAMGVYVPHDYADAGLEPRHKRDGLSCRCVQD